jgi:hypothetical protein
VGVWATSTRPGAVGGSPIAAAAALAFRIGPARAAQWLAAQVANRGGGGGGGGDLGCCARLNQPRW